MERNHKVGKRWTETHPEYQKALLNLEFQQKSVLLKKLKNDVAEYHFMLETKKKPQGWKDLLDYYPLPAYRIPNLVIPLKHAIALDFL